MKCYQIKKYLEKKSGLEDIGIKSRKTKYIKHRSMYYYLCMRYAVDAKTYEEIAALVNKDHASLINGLKTFESFMLSDSDFNKKLGFYENDIKSKLPKTHNDVIKKIDEIPIEILKGRLYRAKYKIHLLQNKLAKYI